MLRIASFVVLITSFVGRVLVFCSTKICMDSPFVVLTTSSGDRLFCGFDHDFCWALRLRFASKSTSCPVAIANVHCTLLN